MASRRPARTIAAPRAIPAPARQPRTTPPTTGSTCRRARARRWAASCARPMPARAGNPATVEVPARAGIGLRAAHYGEILARAPALAFLEVHTENFYAAGGQALAWLERFRERYPLSFHGVGLSLGSADPLDERHLERLAALAGRFEPALVSEHLSWSSARGRHANDLLPLPCTREAIDHVVARIGRVQERLGRPILVENVTTYARFADDEMPEWAFVAEVVRRSGCGLLLDVNNVYVNAVNHGFDAGRYLDAIDAATIGHMPLARHQSVDGRLLDTHAA